MRAIEIQSLIEDFNQEQNNGEETKYDPNAIGQKTLMVRTKMEVTSNFMLLLCLYVFGLKTVHLNSSKILKDLEKIVKQSQND